jgi:hypothetical protein
MRKMLARVLAAPVVRRSANPIIISDLPRVANSIRRRSSASVHGLFLIMAIRVPDCD